MNVMAFFLLTCCVFLCVIAVGFSVNSSCLFLNFLACVNCLGQLSQSRRCNFKIIKLKTETSCMLSAAKEPGQAYVSLEEKSLLVETLGIMLEPWLVPSGRLIKQWGR